MYLLDTHTLLWWLAERSRLSADARLAITDAGNSIFVSAGSVWEIEIKSAAGKLRTPNDLEEQISENGFKPLPISFAHARRAAHLPRHHADPFDRLLVAQAVEERLTIITRDSAIPKYAVPVLAA